MSALHWLGSEAFTAFGRRVTWSDMLGNTIGLTALALGWRRNVLTYLGLVLRGMRERWLRSRTAARPAALEGALS